jgi:hypothetical protein
VEFALIVPVFLLILLSMLDFGYAFYTNLTIEYATREGARVGAAVANGGGVPGCGPGQSPHAADVDLYVMAAVERVLDSAGIRIDVDPNVGGGVQSVRIFKADPTTGADTLGLANVWNYSVGGGPTIPDTTARLDFVETSHGWDPCSRQNRIAAPDSIGVAISYDYSYITPLASVFRLISPSGGVPTLKLNDRTVMHLNPTGE